MFHHGAPASRLDELATLALFHGLTRRERERVASLCTMFERRAGTVLCREGQPGQECFVIIDGELAVTIDEIAVATLGAGSFCGELALLDGAPRTASVTATTDVRLLVFTRREFEELLACAPRVARRVLATVGTRLRHANGRVRAPIEVSAAAPSRSCAP
jgi:CRP-like cAMP-binding protein